MDLDHASQIAYLLNTRNQLQIHYDAALVMQHADEYLLDLADDGRVACCAQVKHVQWYQAEICHVTTHPDFVRQGRGLRMIERAEEVARKKHHARLAQSTIREGNKQSTGLFQKAGYAKGTTFLNPSNGHSVSVWTKPLYRP